MRILVIEDSPDHIESAKRTLEGHELTIVSYFDEAMELMKPDEFDAVLTDMMLPMSNKLDKNYYKTTDPVSCGFIIALRATLCGAKYIGMLTDINHHKGAMAAALDYLDNHLMYLNTSTCNSVRPNFIINGAKVMFVHAPMTKKVTVRECLCIKGIQSQRYFDQDGNCTMCNGTGQHDVEDEQVRVKNWGKVLADLVA